MDDTPLQDEYKDYITQLNKWYSAGLLDNDLANNQGTLIDSKIVNNEAGALVNGYLGSGIGRYLSQKKGDDSGFNLVGAPYPVLKKGDKNAFPIAENDVMPARTIAILYRTGREEKARGSEDSESSPSIAQKPPKGRTRSAYTVSPTFFLTIAGPIPIANSLTLTPDNFAVMK